MIGVNLASFPFIDNTVAQTPGKPENCEDRARGYVGDEEAGQPSKIVSEIFHG